MATHKMLPSCVEIHTILAENSKFQCKALEEIKVELKSINEKMEAQSNRIWVLYIKIIMVGFLSGTGASALVQYFQ